MTPNLERPQALRRIRSDFEMILTNWRDQQDGIQYKEVQSAILGKEKTKPLTKAGPGSHSTRDSDAVTTYQHVSSRYCKEGSIIVLSLHLCSGDCTRWDLAERGCQIEEILGMMNRCEGKERIS